MIVLNETPLKTSNNFNINNITIEKLKIPANLSTFTVNGFENNTTFDIRLIKIWK